MKKNCLETITETKTLVMFTLLLKYPWKRYHTKRIPQPVIKNNVTKLNKDKSSLIVFTIECKTWLYLSLKLEESV